MRTRRTVAAALAVVALALTLTACGSPKSKVDGSFATLTVGSDIVPGTWTTDYSSGAARCMYKVYTDTSWDYYVGVSQTTKDEALYGDSLFAPKRVLTAPTLRPLGQGLTLRDGQVLAVRDCGTLTRTA